jgi:hypothetical protein
MFERSSRYAPLPTAIAELRDGRLVRYVRRRFLPPSGSHRLLVEVTVSEGDRLDTIAQRTIGNPEQYWRICDANDAMEPASLTEEPGRVLAIPLPQI